MGEEGYISTPPEFWTPSGSVAAAAAAGAAPGTTSSRR